MSKHQPTVDRRTFLKSATLATAGVALAQPGFAAPSDSTGKRKRYAIVGTGSRYSMYRRAILEQYKEHAELVALCDTNPGRLELALKKSKEAGGNPRTYAASDFDKMLAETKPDAVIVTCVDAFHHEYIVKTLDAGLHPISEKPMTNTAERCQAVLDAASRNKKHCTVTFNYRYSPPRTQVKDLLMSGVIGDVLSVDFQWLLNTSHGADYFRRWHAWKKFSQGLMLHKSTHHFDLANWWIGANPVEIHGTAKREFYTSKMAKRYGLQGAHERCLTCPEKDKCGFYLNLAGNENLKELYLDNEKYDGYHRDQCVWRDDHDIEDTMNVLVKYDNGVQMNYSLNAFNAWEGYNIAFNGTLGRLEHSAVESIYTSGTGGDDAQGAIKEKGITTTIIPLRGPAQRIEPWTGTGGHGGGDKVLLDDLFLPAPTADKYKRAADERAGAASILVGIAANHSFQSGQPTKVSDLVKNLPLPEHAPMPAKDTPLPMPGKAKKEEA